jgi:hypothetical protein
MLTSHAPDDYLSELRPALELEPALDAAWLGGSYGRGIADRWSDLDLHVLLAAGGDAFRLGIEPWLGAVRPLVLFKLLFDGRMVNALTIDGVRLDVWFHTEPPVLDPAAAYVLFDRTNRLHFQPPAAPETPAPAVTAAALRSQIEEFWRCIALLPPVIGRHEYIVAFQGLNVELNLLLDILLRSVVRESGVKRLNAYLPEALRREVETALTLDGPTVADGLVRAHLALADIVRVHGRMLAQSWDFAYPYQLEEAVLRYVADELGLLGFTSSPPRVSAR